MAAKQSLSFALEPRATAAFDDYVVDCAWARDGKSVAIAGGEGKVALARADGDTLELEVIGEHLLGTLCVAWRPHADSFATSGQDGAVALWDAATGKELKRWKPAPTPTQSLSFTPGGEAFATAAGKVVTLWSALGEKIHAFAPAATSAVALAFDRPGTDLGVALNGEIAVHRIENSRYETRRYKWPAACLTVNFSGNGRFLASGMADGSLHFWNRSTGKDSQMRGYDGRLELVGWSDNSRYLASSAGNEVVLWDFSGKGPEGTKPIVLNGHTERVDSFAWQPGGEHFVTAGRDWRLTLWRPAKASQPIDVQMLDSEISVVRWSPDGKRVVVGEKQGRVSVFELVAR
ncbi:MAG TPA: WD40 repeat domain-containing protein [Steroidobacteraceae bacterium]|jgi:WD40 repeat protein|nr:WD40 repeat domain-containing protein [Steroidobacteraceae bacterium]